jgi:hypothetical protein
MLQGKDAKDGLTYIEDSLESHIMAFAAEQARHEQRIVEMEEWRVLG